MYSRLRSRLTYANVMSSLAFFLALGGGAAYAANTVFSTDIVDGEVKNADIAPSSVGNGKIIDNSVTGTDVSDGSLTGADLAADSVGTLQLQDRGVTTGKLASDAVTREKLGVKAVDQSAMGDNSVASAEIVGSTVRAQELGSIVDRTAVGTIDGTQATASAFCRAGEQVVSGGMTAIDARVQMVHSSRHINNGWTIRATNGSNQDENFTIHAYCLVP